MASPFTGELTRGITGVLTWTVPAAVWLAVCAGPVLRLLYQRGLFSAADSQAAAAVLAIYAAGLVPLALLQLLPRAYHARQDTLRPLGLYALGLGAYLGLAPPLAAAWGAAGLAAAFSLESYLAAGLFLWGLWPDLRPVAGALLRTTARVLAAGLVLAGACAGWLRWGPAGAGDSLADRVALVAILAGGGLAVYAMAMTALSGGWGRAPGGPRPTPAIARDPTGPDPE